MSRVTNRGYHTAGFCRQVSSTMRSFSAVLQVRVGGRAQQRGDAVLEFSACRSKLL